MIRIEHIIKSFDEGKRNIFDNINHSFIEGNLYVVKGVSGSGNLHF